MGSYRESVDVSSNENSEYDSFRELQPCSSFSSGCQAAGFHWELALLVFRVITYLGGKDEKCHVKIPQNVLFLLRFSSVINVLKFFLNKCSPDYCKLLVNFEFSKSWFCQFLPVLSLLLWKREFYGVLILLFSLMSSLWKWIESFWFWWSVTF